VVRRQGDIILPQVLHYSSPIELSETVLALEIKRHYLNALPTFHGTDDENALKFMREFCAEVSEIPRRNITLDEMRMKCFSTSMKDKAKAWFRSLEGGSLKIWADVFKKFMERYYSFQTTKQLRRDISNFEQQDGETFHEAWERYEELLRACPQHAFSDIIVN
jgi:Retrotransposon gag protein